MIKAFSIHTLALGAGRLGICRMPGRYGDYPGDLAAIVAWAPALVLSMATSPELRAKGAGGLGADLAAAGIDWRHVPVDDYAAQSHALEFEWPEASALAHRLLASGKGVVAHCMGGCGRSGMALMRLMVEAGDDADPALARLRDIRPCAVETEDQRAWAARPMWERLRRG